MFLNVQKDRSRNRRRRVEKEREREAVCWFNQVKNTRRFIGITVTESKHMPAETTNDERKKSKWCREGWKSVEKMAFPFPSHLFDASLVIVDALYSFFLLYLLVSYYLLGEGRRKKVQVASPSQKAKATGASGAKDLYLRVCDDTGHVTRCL